CFSASAPSEARACTQRNGMDLWISGRRGGDDVVFRHHRQCCEFRRASCRKRAAWCVFRTVHLHCARQMARAHEKETATAGALARRSALGVVSEQGLKKDEFQADTVFILLRTLTMPS